MLHETHKIMGVDFPISATCVRVPVLRSHSESLSIAFEKEFDLKEVYEVLKTPLAWLFAMIPVIIFTPRP